MISLYSLNAVTNAMKLCKQHNVRLDADEESPIGLLNKATDQAPIFNTGITDEQFFQNLPDITKIKTPAHGTGEASVVADTAAGAEMLNVEDHEPTLFELKNMAIQRCNGMLDFARNVIQPFVQNVIQNNQPVEQVELSEEWNLVPVGMDAALESPVVQALIDEVENPLGNGTTHEAVNANVPTNLEVPETGNKMFDNLVATLLNETGMSIVEAVQGMLEGNLLSPVSDQAPHNLKKNILFMLLASYYVERPWENSNLGSGEWRAKMLPLYYSNVGWVYAYAEGIVARVATGNVVYSYDGDEKKVYICQEAFKDYLEKGGDVEALLGAIYLLDDGDSSVSTRVPSLLEKQNDYRAAYGRRSAIQRAKNDTDWLTRNRASLKTAFAVAVDTLDREYLARDAQGNLFTPEQIKTGVFSSIDHLFGNSTKDITEFVIRTSAAEVFGEYDLCNLLLEIHQGMVANRQPDEVATDWMINYVINWVGGAICVDVLKRA